MLGAISPPGKISRGFSMRHARTDFSIRTVLASSGSLRGGTCRACVCGGALVAVCGGGGYSSGTSGFEGQDLSGV